MQKTELDAVLDLIRTGAWPEGALNLYEFGSINDAVNDVRAQMRREKRRDDAAWLERCADEHYADDGDAPRRIALRIAAQALRAQED